MPTYIKEFCLFIFGIVCAQGLAELRTPNYPEYWFGWLVMVGGAVAAFVTLRQLNKDNSGLLNVTTDKRFTVDIREPHASKILDLINDIRVRGSQLVKEAAAKDIKLHTPFLKYRKQYVQQSKEQEIHGGKLDWPLPISPLLTELKKDDSEYSNKTEELKRNWIYLRHDDKLNISIDTYLKSMDFADSERMAIIIELNGKSDVFLTLGYQRIIAQQEETLEIPLKLLAERVEYLGKGGKAKWTI
jgi:hypothetical protein